MKKTCIILVIIITLLAISCVHRKLLKTPVINPENEIDPHSGYIYGCFQNHYIRDWHYEPITFALELVSIDNEERNPEIIHIQFTDIVDHSSPTEIIEFGFSSINKPGKDIQLIKLQPGEYKITNVFYTNTDGKIYNKLSDSEPDVQENFTVKPGMLTYIGSLRGETITEFSRNRWRIRGIFDYFPEETCYLEQKYPKTKEFERYNIFTQTLCSRPLTLIAAMRNGYVSELASSELVQMGKSVLTPLIAALEVKNVNIREGAVRVLGRIGDFQAVDPLITTLEDEDSNVRTATAWALGKIADTKAVVSLTKLLGDEEKEVRRSVSWALERIGDLAVKPLILTLNDDKTVVRQYAAEVLGKIGNSKAVIPLRNLIDDKDENVRQAAASALVKINDVNKVDFLINALKDKNSEVRLSAAEGLGIFGVIQAVEPLIKTLMDEEKSVRLNAAVALGRIGDPRAVEALIETLDDENWEVCWGAVWALGQIGDPQAVEPLINVLKDERLLPGAFYQSTVRALNTIGDLRAVDPLINTLISKYKYPGVRFEAFIILTTNFRCSYEEIQNTLRLKDINVMDDYSPRDTKYPKWDQTPGKWSTWWEKNKEKF